jgi:O-antigen ligase
MVGFSRLAHFDRSSLPVLADWAVIAVAIALPWSTSAVGIAIAVWLVLLLPSLDAACLKRELATAAGGLPVLLWGFSAIGMLWADASWHDRLAGLDGFHRLLAIPLMLAQFRRSGNGIAVVLGFFISATGVLIASYAIVLVLGHKWPGAYGVPVHDAIFQGTLCLICGFGALGYAALERGKQNRSWILIVCTAGVLFLLNFGVSTASRIALAIAPILLLLLGWRLLRWKGLLIGLLIAIIAASTIWFASPTLRDRVAWSVMELEEYRATDKATSIGEHIAFLKESFSIAAAAPIIGHGTGSIADQFRRVTAGKTGASAEPTVNPHNQTFGVVIQLGLLGAVLLWAMWIAHLFLFAGRGTVSWLGLLVVLENILSSIVHSHLFDFNNGWLYVFGVGVLGGTILNQRDHTSKNSKPVEVAHPA